MEELIKMLTNYGVSIVIVALFLWDWINNKKDIKKTLETIEDSNKNISDCLTEMRQSNNNISKSLDLLQQSMDNQDKKIDKILERKFI